jgi:hypothetical protein
MLTNLLNLKEYLLAIKPVGGGGFCNSNEIQKILLVKLQLSFDLNSIIRLDYEN